MRSYPLSFVAFADKSVTASYSPTASFALPTVVTASFTLIPSGSKGNKGTNGGVIYLLSSSIGVCYAGTTTTTSTTTTTTTSTTTTTTTQAPTGVYCLNGDAGVGCLFYEGFESCAGTGGTPCDPFATTTTTTLQNGGGGSNGCPAFLCNGGLGNTCGDLCSCVGGDESPGNYGACRTTGVT